MEHCTPLSLAILAYGLSTLLAAASAGFLSSFWGSETTDNKIKESLFLSIISNAVWNAQQAGSLSSIPTKYFKESDAILFSSLLCLPSCHFCFPLLSAPLH